MVCVLAHVDLGDIFRLVGHHSATPPSLRNPKPDGRCNTCKTGTRYFPSWKHGFEILNSSAPSRNKRIVAVCQRFVAVYAHLLFINFSFL